MDILAIIPARSGSKGIIGKNKKLLRGKPLIQYTIDAALSSKKLKTIVVSTDDDEIIEICNSQNIPVQIRPKHLCGDLVPTLPVLQNVVSNLNMNFDAVMTLQPTSPLRSSKHIDEAIEIFQSNQIADSLVSIIKVPHNYNPESLMVKDGDLLIPYLKNHQIIRRQNKKVYFARNGAAIYLTKIDILSRAILGDKTLGYEMSFLESIDIDSKEDWDLAELILTNRK